MQRSAREIATDSYRAVLASRDQAGIAQLGRRDLFFLLAYLLGRADINKDWLFDRCREVQASPNGHLDLWAREHCKSSIITFGLTIQDILNDPEITIGIFSHTKPIARGFLKQIKREFELNEALKDLYPDVLYRAPQKESPQWSEDGGIIVKRKGNPKEATVEAWGLVDGQPTSKHYSLLIYDDVVTRESVSTPEQIAKTTEALALSYNLGARGGHRRWIGTHYHFADTYTDIIKRGTVKVRKYPATDDGKATGRPVLLSPELLAEKRRDFGQYVFSCHGAGTLVTMGDWSHKPIEDIKVGDTVVGWAFVDGKSRAKLRPTTVAAINNRPANAVKTVLSNGDELIHTKDHKWWNGRSPKNIGRNLYAPIGLKYRELNQVQQAVNLKYVLAPGADKQCGYLAGIFDGEGSLTGGRETDIGLSSGAIHISQDSQINPEICSKIESCLAELDLPYSFYTVKRGKRGGVAADYCLTGGRQTKVRFLHLTKGLIGKHKRVSDSCYGGAIIKAQPKVVSQEDIGQIQVYNIQTETGNYLANGYCSKNCQMLLAPVAEGDQKFKLEWIRRYLPRDIRPDMMNRYIVVDPAGSKKRKENDYSVFMVIGLGMDNNFYLLKTVRKKMSLTERGKTMMELHRKWKPMGVGYEQVSMQADIEYIKELMKQENYHFPIIELTPKDSKEDRILALVPLFEFGRMWLPQEEMTVEDGRPVNLTEALVVEEYSTFPFSAHDDMLDDLSNILSPKMNLVWPMPAVEFRSEPFNQYEEEASY